MKYSYAENGQHEIRVLPLKLTVVDLVKNFQTPTEAECGWKVL